MVLQQIVDKESRSSGKNSLAAPAVKTVESTPKAPVPTPTPAKAAPAPAPAPAVIPAPVPVPVIPVVQAKQVPAPVSAPVKPKPVSVAPKPKVDNSKATPALQIVSEESGIAFEDLTDDSNFADIGVDSLLSMVIGSRFREELGLDLEADFSIFVDLPTVRQLKEFLGAPSGDSAAPSTEDEAADEDIVSESTITAPPPVVIVPAGIATPAPIEIPATIAIPAPVEVPVAVENPKRVFTETKAPVAAPVSTSAIPALQIISEESGIALEDLTDESNFADIGVDSLLSMVIGSRFREELGLDLEADFSIFVDLPTVRDLKLFLAGDSSSSSDMSSETSISSPDETPDESEVDEPSMKFVPFCKPATSVILQGIPKVAKKTLFLLPDGSGSSSSYVPIPRLKADVAIVGLNCPYAREPENMNCTHTSMIESFCTEIRRRQPKGPYHLGGWSSGGAFAYVCAETLVNQGEEVASIIIIDAPVPQVMDKLPASFYEYCNNIGLFSGGVSNSSTIPPSARSMTNSAPGSTASQPSGPKSVRL